jgi:hypothetical protein
MELSSTGASQWVLWQGSMPWQGFLSGQAVLQVFPALAEQFQGLFVAVLWVFSMEQHK